MLTELVYMLLDAALIFGFLGYLFLLELDKVPDDEGR